MIDLAFQLVAIGVSMRLAYACGYYRASVRAHEEVKRAVYAALTGGQRLG